MKNIFNEILIISKFTDIPVVYIMQNLSNVQFEIKKGGAVLAF